MPSPSSAQEQKGIIYDVLRKCAEAGVNKVTFVGGEPLLFPYLIDCLKIAKNLDITTCVVTNGSLVTKKWMTHAASSLDWLGVSIDSLHDHTNVRMGRYNHTGPIPESHYREVIQMCHMLDIKLKTNTTVCRLNQSKDISNFLLWATPHRIKIFQALTIEGINDHNQDIICITNDSFKAFVKRHQDAGLDIISETNADMIGSYLMISPDGRFFDNFSGSYHYSLPIPKVGLAQALNEIRTSPKRFRDRGGHYNW